MWRPRLPSCWLQLRLALLVVRPKRTESGGIDSMKPLSTPSTAKQAVAVAVCNGTDYTSSEPYLQIVRAKALACSLQGSGLDLWSP